MPLSVVPQCNKLVQRNDLSRFEFNGVPEAAITRLWMVIVSVGLPWATATNALYGDCGGEFLVWWYQNMPGVASDGRKMKSIWPYMFY